MSNFAENLDMKRYLYILIFGIVTLIAGQFIYQNKQLARYKELYNKELQNVEAYRASNSGLEGEIRQYQMSMDDLRASKDSLDMKLVEAVDGLKVKDKYIEYLQYQSTVAHKVDTVNLKDTIFVQDILIDTVLSDNWYRLELGLRYPSSIIVSPTFNSEKTIIVNSKKVYNKTPSKIFFIRWFQKKHNVIEVNIEEKSPYITNKSQKFIKVIKDV